MRENAAYRLLERNWSTHTHIHVLALPSLSGIIADDNGSKTRKKKKNSEYLCINYLPAAAWSAASGSAGGTSAGSSLPSSAFLPIQLDTWFVSPENILALMLVLLFKSVANAIYCFSPALSYIYYNTRRWRPPLRFLASFASSVVLLPGQNGSISCCMYLLHFVEGEYKTEN